MSATVTPNLEPSERPMSPVRPLSVHQVSEDPSATNSMEFSNMWDSMPIKRPIREEQVNGLLDISAQSKYWAVSPRHNIVEENHESANPSSSSGVESDVNNLHQQEFHIEEGNDDEDSELPNFSAEENDAMDMSYSDSSLRVCEEMDTSGNVLTESVLEVDAGSTLSHCAKSDNIKSLGDDTHSLTVCGEMDASSILTESVLEVDTGSTFSLSTSSGDSSKSFGVASKTESQLNSTEDNDHIDVSMEPGNICQVDNCSRAENESVVTVKSETMGVDSTESENYSLSSVKSEVFSTDCDHSHPGYASENNGLLNIKSEVVNDDDNPSAENATDLSNGDESEMMEREGNHFQTTHDDTNSLGDDSSEVIDLPDLDNTSDAVSVTSNTVEEELVGTPPPQEQEVVDVENDQPCVVDLTCEDEDDVDVVAVVEPVIFIGRGRRHRRRRRRSQGYEDRADTGDNREPGETIDDDDSNNNVIGQEHPNRLLANAPFIEFVGEGAQVANDDRNNNNAAQQEEEDRILDFWQALNAPPEIDLHNPNLTFGSLLEQGDIETLDDNPQQPLPVPQNHLATARRTFRELRRSARRRRRSGSRSRSPDLFEALQLNAPLNQVENLNPAFPVEGEHDLMLPHDVPNLLPLNPNRTRAEGRRHRAARIPPPPPNPPPSPPPIEQPTINCLVCLDSIATINSSSRSLCSTVCGHVFCSACIEEVVKQRKQCPVCRKRLTKKQYHPLFI